MPVFAALLSSGLSGLAGFFASFLGYKVAVATAAVTALTAAATVLLLAMNTIITPVVAALFSTQYGQVLGLAFPPYAGTCMGIMGTCWTACTLYGWQRTAIQISAST